MEGESYSFAGDIWSLGIIIIEMVTGEYPYKEMKGFLEMMEQINFSESPNVPQNEHYSAELRDFIDKCLKKDAEERGTVLSLLAHPWLLKYSQS